ncbi:ParB N-terminal domain-containing protein [Paracoccus shandongensis]|uniref:ParB N-terminal domain-containing protein n=1 Tax=Paracoccus shandongensis TaxID=2816048 RepID=UPI001F178526|nr:ParB N-terminal domain-containing protein [Paracoccus shandongensis]
MPLCPRAQCCDRATAAGFKLAELVQSIRDIGLSNPIRVEPGREGRYELIQGWRRLTAYRKLLKNTAMRKAGTAFTRASPRGAMRWNSSIAARSITTWSAKTSRLQKWRIWRCIFRWTCIPPNTIPTASWRSCSSSKAIRSAAIFATSSAWSRLSARY